MNKYILVNEDIHGNTSFVHNQNGGDSYTYDVNQAMIYESEADAKRERFDDERVAKLTFNPDGSIESYDII